MCYDLLDLIDSGGFADVYRARRRDTGEILAVKMLRDSHCRDARHRFAREVTLLQSCPHGGIVPVLDANVDAERPFYVMPLMQGGSLTKWAGKLTLDRFRATCIRIAAAIQFLHARGTLHRDIKPDNVLLDARGVCAVGDLGLGNNPQFTVKFTASAGGTPGYAAPELVEGWGIASSAADVYSLGATFFHLATGIHPRQATSLDPFAYGARIPKSMRDLIVEMLDRDPARRPTAAHVWARLSALHVETSPGANRGLAVAAGTAFAALIALSIIGTFKT